ncbi:MAG: DUF4175 domain-containing protein [Saprospiraceae bacterium]|nr:DUF4175 domain-containing protein [Saprospiraceae bacterium]
MMVRDNYSLLIEKLDGFIRKFYVNQLLRGALYTVGLVLGLFIVLNVLEYYFYFNSKVRTGMFWGFLLISGAALYRWIALPLLHYFHLGKVISHEQAAQIIGQHFAGVKDKLLNILQLKQQSSNAIYADLINASINQKSEEIKLVPFKMAIDLRSNRKYLRYALPPVLLLLFLFLGAPNILREGAYRLWNSNKAFEKPAPFRFILQTDSLRAVQFSDYVLKVKVEGQALPNEVFINLGKVQYRLTKDAPNEFSYKFSNVQLDTKFNLFSGAVESREYLLNVLRKPNILSFNVKLNYPSYLGRPNEELSNVGDLVIPQGTNIGWVFNVQNTDHLSMRFGNEAAAEAKRFDDELFSFSRRALKDEPYKIFIANELLPNGDSVAYTVTIIPDQHPQISVEEFRDSTNKRMIFFAGDAADDYGLLNLTFNYQVKKAKGGQLPLSTLKLNKPAGKQIQYEHTWDLRNIDLAPGDEITYYFEVGDNDAVNGSKTARTNLMQWRMPSLAEVEKQQAENSEQIKKDLEKALKESAKVNEEMKKLRDKILQQKNLDWQSRKELERLLERQKQIQQQLEQAKQNFQENRQQQQEMNQQQTEDLQKKEEQLEKLMEEALSPEQKQLMEEIEKMLQEMNKEEMLDKMEQMQLNNEELNKELDRLQELYKQLEVENMLQQQIDKLEELAKEQDELNKETEQQQQNEEQKGDQQNQDEKKDGQKSDQELQQQQEELNKKMDDLQKKQQELEQKNKELKRPQKIEDSQQEMQDIKNDMKDAGQQLEQKQKNKAGKKQKSASNKMKNLANKMKQNQSDGEMEQMEEDIAMLRQLLENLIGLSFAQEQNMKDIAATTINTPRYVELTQQQYKIKDDFKIVEDSLQALAKRNFKLEGVVTEKVTEVKSAIGDAVSELEERRTGTATEQQQRSMKAMNDLALLLSEIMNNMQQEMAANMPGNQSCQKPGEGEGKSGKKPMDKITKGQKSLGDQMQDLKQRMEQGKGQGTMSKDFAQMAAQQAAMRNALRELQKQKQAEGKGSKALDELMQEMEKNEVDLVNKRLTNEMLKRQEQIMTRLLEEERAEREREQDEQRQAQTAQQQPAKLPPALEEYLKKRRAEVDMYRTVSPSLKPYYKGLVEEYIKAGQ